MIHVLMENLSTDLDRKGLIKKHEFIRVIVQCLYSLGYEESAACLESEANVSYKSAEFKLLESQILGANWDDCLDTLYGIKDLTDEVRASAVFLVFKQCLLEILSRGDDSMALALLRKQISSLNVGKEKVHKLAFGMLSGKEMGKVEDHIICELRKRLLTKLEKVLPPPIALPERRLEHLVEMAVSAQIDSCMYHNSVDAVTICEDHHCGRDQIPTETFQVCKWQEIIIFYPLPTISLPHIHSYSFFYFNALCITSF